MTSTRDEKVKLGDISELITKGTTPTSIGCKFVNCGINFIKVESINSNGKINKEKFEHIDISTNEKLGRSKINDGDILFSMAGTLGRVAIVSQDVLPANTNQALAIIRLKKDIVLPKYIYYYMRQKSFVRKVNSMSGQSVQPNINLEEIKSLMINLPKISGQKTIVDLLSCLDNMIDINRETNYTLELISQTIYRHWFMDYEFPNEDGKPYKSSAGKFIDSEMGNIPEGWKVETISSISKKVSKGSTPTKDDVNFAQDQRNIIFLKVKDLSDNGEIIETDLELISKTIHEKVLKRSILETDDILFSIAGTIGRVCVLPKNLNGSNANQAIAFIRLIDKKIKDFIYLVLKSNKIQDSIKSKLVQGVQANVSLSVLSEQKFIFPDKIILNKFIKITDSIFSMINCNKLQNQTLSQLRDSLLPRLMSGKILIK